MSEGIQQIVQALQALAEKLGPSAALLWEQACRQSIINGWTTAAHLIGLYALCGVALLVCSLGWLRDDDNMFAVAGFGSAILFVLCLAVSAEQLPNAIGQIKNPELYAVGILKEMLTK